MLSNFKLNRSTQTNGLFMFLTFRVVSNESQAELCSFAVKIAIAASPKSLDG